MIFHPHHTDLKGTLLLPGSKSESNRALMIAGYGGFDAGFKNMSASHDTVLLQKLLCQIRTGKSNIVDCEDAGSVCRFLLTYLCSHEGDWVLTGSERLRQRPIADLVDALKRLGAAIQYFEKDGCLPLKIKGAKVSGGSVPVSVERSSQFASSLLMAAPMWSNGLELELTGSLRSLPYVDMTLSLMRWFGAVAVRDGNNIRVASKPYENRPLTIAPDWSAASYWYEMVALSTSSDLLLKDLHLPSWQGDAAIARMMRDLGVETIIEPEGVRLKKTQCKNQPPRFDFSSTPDLFPAVAATCAGLRREARFTGLATLHLKESDRVVAMANELQKMGAVLESVSDDECRLVPPSDLPRFEDSNPLLIDTYNDHRVAMAMAPLSLLVGAIRMDQPEVVAKSYPGFWEDFRKVL